MVREQKKWESKNQKCRQAEANAGSKTEKQPRRITQDHAGLKKSKSLRWWIRIVFALCGVKQDRVTSLLTKLVNLPCFVWRIPWAGRSQAPTPSFDWSRVRLPHESKPKFCFCLFGFEHVGTIRWKSTFRPKKRHVYAATAATSATALQKWPLRQVMVSWRMAVGTSGWFRRNPRASRLWASCPALNSVTVRHCQITPRSVHSIHPMNL